MGASALNSAQKAAVTEKGVEAVYDAYMTSNGVHWALEDGVMNGVSPRQFDPDGATSRAMVATMLWRLEGSPIVSDEMEFVDVADGMWYTEAVRWAVGAGILTGMTGGTREVVLAPQNASSRAVVATMFMRFCERLPA